MEQRGNYFIKSPGWLIVGFIFLVSLSFVIATTIVNDNGITTESLNGAYIVDANDGTDIQTKIDSCPSDGCEIIIPCGIYEDPLIDLRSNITIRGYGECTILKLTEDNNIMNHSVESYVENIRIEGILFDGNRTGLGTNYGKAIRFYNGKNLKVMNNYFRNTRGTSVIFNSTRDTLVHENTFENVFGAITYLNSDSGKVAWNFVNVTDEEFVDLNGGNSNIHIISNTVHNNGEEAVDINGASYHIKVISNMFIDNTVAAKSAIYSIDESYGNEFAFNTILNYSGDGITIGNQGDGVSYGNRVIGNSINSSGSRGIALVDNTFDNEIVGNEVKWSGSYNIFLSGADRNTIGNNIVSYADSEGIYVFSSDFNSVTGNVAFNNGKGGTTGAGIRVGGTANNNTIVGNVATDNQATRTQLYGIRTRDTSSENSYFSNKIVGNNNSDFSDESSGSSTYIIYNQTCLISSNGGCI